MSILTHARFRRAVRARGHFPTESAALKCVYPLCQPLLRQS